MDADDNAWPEISVHLVVAGRDGFDPDDCTRALGIQPTGVWRQKHKHLLNHPELPQASWKIGVENMRCYDVDEAVCAFLEMIWPLRGKIKAYVSSMGWRADISCNVLIRSQRPMYRLLPETLRKLAHLELEFGMDIHDLT
jgi:hypothetical protein